MMTTWDILIFDRQCAPSEYHDDERQQRWAVQKQLSNVPPNGGDLEETATQLPRVRRDRQRYQHGSLRAQPRGGGFSGVLID